MRPILTHNRWRILLSTGLASMLISAVLAIPSTAVAADACTLLSVDELAKIIGQRVRKPRPDTAEKGTACGFGTATDSVSIALWPTNAKDFAEFRKLLAENGAKIEDASGLGDAAYFWEDDRVYVRLGDQGLTVTLGGGDDSFDAKRREIVMAIAKAGIAKL